LDHKRHYGGDKRDHGSDSIVGLNPDFTVLGTKVLFRGDGAGGVGLWVTDRTTTGTSELTSAGSSSLGLLYFTTSRLLKKGASDGCHPSRRFAPQDEVI
jgi:hypothetical protein